MTDSKYGHILMIIDRSGSMSTIQDASEEGIRGFVKEQQELAEDGIRVTLSLAQFDDKFEWVDRMRVVADPSLNMQPAFSYALKPRNATALLDGIGKAVVEDGDRLEALSEDDRPGKVVVLIVTDGRENASREWTYDSIEKLITQQKNDYTWEFVFLSSDLTSAKMSKDLGVQNTMNFHNTGASTRSAYKMSSSGVSSYLSGKTTNIDVPSDAE